MKWYVADFETTTEKHYELYGLTEVWLYAISDDNGKIINWGSNIDLFMLYIKNLKDSIIYFHNLKFDGSFILTWLIENGFEYKDRLFKKDNKGYTCLISEEGQYYQITINFKKGVQVVIQDSLKLLPFQLRK